MLDLMRRKLTLKISFRSTFSLNKLIFKISFCHTFSLNKLNTRTFSFGDQLSKSDINKYLKSFLFKGALSFNLSILKIFKQII